MAQDSPLKILLHLSGGTHWMGGVQYTRNIIRAVSLLPESERPEIVLQLGRNNAGLGFEEEFSKYSNLIMDGKKSGGGEAVSKFEVFIRRLQRKLFGKEIKLNDLYSDDCSVVFPVKGPNQGGPVKKVFWIPDFQYKHYPEFFSPEELKQRDVMYAKMLSEDGLLVLSSNAVKSDFLQFFPEHKNKEIRILNFCTTLEDDDYRPNPEAVCSQYGLPEKFVYLPNQIWQHKGFFTVLEAISILKTRGLEIPLISTGSKVDYRMKHYFNQIEQKIEKDKLGKLINILGLLPRLAQIQIFRRAALILQPSYFEGWSTIVEDSRALGRPILLSDIDVHREQNPDRATFFSVGNANDLADKLEKLWSSALPGPNISAELISRQLGKSVSIRFAETFLKIMEEANSRSV